MKTALVILFLAYLQNISFSVVSRARNRNNFYYHLIASGLSNTVWFLTFRQLVLAQMSLVLFVPYTAGTIMGSLSGARISMSIERWIRATSDGHIESENSSGRVPNQVRKPGSQSGAGFRGAKADSIPVESCEDFGTGLPQNEG